MPPPPPPSASFLRSEAANGFTRLKLRGAGPGRGSFNGEERWITTNHEHDTGRISGKQSASGKKVVIDLLSDQSFHRFAKLVPHKPT